MTALANHGLEDVTRHFNPHQWYRVWGQCNFKMHREGRQVTGRGDYFLGTAQGYFTNMGLRDPRIYTDHRLILAVIRGEGVAHNRRY